MFGKTLLGVLVMVVGVAGLILPTQPLPAADRISGDENGKAKDRKPRNDGKRKPISVDVVVEEVNLSANTITARSTLHVIPPHDNVGGVVYATGTTDAHKDQATKYVRLPVMPQAKLTKNKPKVGQRAILRLELLQQGSGFALVVVGIDEFTGLERIGVNWLDAPGAKVGN